MQKQPNGKYRPYVQNIQKKFLYNTKVMQLTQLDSTSVYIHNIRRHRHWKPLNLSRSRETHSI